MSESDLLAAILDAARLLGIRSAHFRPAWTAKGYRTAVQGDGKGFPDLVLTGPRGVLYRELKGPRGSLTTEQGAWLYALATAGQDAGVWTPAEWPEPILTELRAIGRRTA